ncbi:TetR/AcrR family transcriptional regulator [Micromonospora sp. NBC_00421]|uniref:TetR/AcrR family transcriptional regulator n=1 Tax=Micromonospora sp. NBC_00421 TaxID=2975976 RepID=UPI002E230562
MTPPVTSGILVSPAPVDELQFVSAHQGFLRYFPAVPDDRRERSRLRAERSDGVENRQRILAVATVVVARDGLQVPLATVAAEAEVGIGTLYRHFPNRAALLDGLVIRSLRVVLEAIRDAVGDAATALDAVRGYFYRVIEHRDQLILPLRGGPAVVSAEAAGLREDVRRELEDILRRGVADGTIQSGLTPLDLILMATMLAQPLPNITDWDLVARRTADVYLAGMPPRSDEPYVRR